MAYVAYIAAQPAWNDLDWRQRLRGGALKMTDMKNTDLKLTVEQKSMPGNELHQQAY